MISERDKCSLKDFDTFCNMHINEIIDDDKVFDFDSCLSLEFLLWQRKNASFHDVPTVSKSIIDEMATETEKESFQKRNVICQNGF